MMLPRRSETFLSSLSSNYTDAVDASDSAENEQPIPATGLLFPALYYEGSPDYYATDENWMAHNSGQWMYCLVDSSYYHVESDSYYHHDPDTGYFYETPAVQPAAEQEINASSEREGFLVPPIQQQPESLESAQNVFEQYGSQASLSYFPTDDQSLEQHLDSQPPVSVPVDQAREDDYFFIDFDQDIVFFTGELMSDMRGKLEREDRHVTKERLALDVMAETQACCLYTSIFDGHGGSLCAQYCMTHLSQNLLTTYQRARNTILKKLKKHEERTGTPATTMDLGLTYTIDIEALRRGLQKSFETTDEHYLEIAEQKGLTDGCTALALLLFGPDEDGSMKLVTAHVGDCRAVLCRGGEAVRLTEDHKPYRKEERRRIETAGGKVTNLRGVWRVVATSGRRVFGLSTSRTIGDLYMKRPKNLVPSTPDLRVCTVDFYRDTFVVLGSDGIWDVITDQEACNLVSEYAGPNCSQKAADALVALAKARGSTDDKTATVVFFNWRRDLLPGHSFSE